MIYRSPYPDADIPNVPLQDFLFEHAAKYTDKAALIDGPTGRAVTYGQLVGAVRRAAAPGWRRAGSARATSSPSTARTCRSTPSRFSASRPPVA